jgi:leucyl/phenylalanyl-tRNA--protein transferase
MIPRLDTNTPFPDVTLALGADSQAPGLLAFGADLSPQRLLDAYRQGIFPWFSDGEPILWWSTDPRMVLFTDRFVISDSLKKKLRKIAKDGAHWQVRFDSAFEQVMRACADARKRGPGTWITESIINAYCDLHRLGFAHSSELWHDGELVGGAYGVCIGRMFYGESMFARESDASKIALAYLHRFLHQHGVVMIDCQQETAHLASLGAVPIPRSEFITHIQTAIEAAPITDWVPPSF